MAGGRKFVMWVCPHILLALIPFLVNLLINLVAGTATFYSVFKVNDLMYFVIVLCGTTLLDVLVDRHRQSVPNIVVAAVLSTILVFAALFLGIYSQYLAEPPASGPYLPQVNRLIVYSLVLSGCALLLTFVAEIRICFHQVGATSNGDG